MARRITPLLVAVALGGLAGCAAGDDGSSLPVDGKADGFGDDAPSLEGDYAFVIESTVESRDGDGRVGAHTTVFWGSAYVDSNGSELLLSIAPCALDLPSFDGRDVSVDAAVLRALSPIDVAGALISSESGWSLATDQGALVLGVSLADPIADEMPDDDDDPRVVDGDGDGEPGVTFGMGGWAVYAGLRVTFSLVGAIGEERRVVGEVELEDEFEIYGDDIPFFSARNALEEASAETETLSESNRFALVPLETGGQPSCEAAASIPYPL